MQFVCMRHEAVSYGVCSRHWSFDPAHSSCAGFCDALSSTFSHMFYSHHPRSSLAAFVFFKVEQVLNDIVFISIFEVD